MSNIYDLERHRRKVYGSMLMQESLERKKLERLQLQQQIKRDNIQIQKHLEDTRFFNQNRKAELKEFNNSLREDNIALATFRKSIHAPHIYSEEGKHFVSQLEQLHKKRLENTKKTQYQHIAQNEHLISNHHSIEEKIREMDRIEAERHQQRVKELQTKSLRRRQDIKVNYQQNMNIYEKHKMLIEQNDHYRDKLQAFTNVNRGLLDRYNRGDNLEKKAYFLENQNEIKKQMEQLERRKSQEKMQYKKNYGNLEHSMMRSMIVRPQPSDLSIYSNDLKHQIENDNIKKLELKNSKKEKIEINNIFGGFNGNQRENMIKFIDKRLGISSYEPNIPLLNAEQKFSQKKIINSSYQNPQKSYLQQNQTNTPRTSSRKSNNVNSGFKIDQSNGAQNGSLSPQLSNYNSPQTTSNVKKSFKAYDLISGKNKYYGF